MRVPRSFALASAAVAFVMVTSDCARRIYHDDRPATVLEVDAPSSDELELSFFNTTLTIGANAFSSPYKIRIEVLKNIFNNFSNYRNVSVPLTVTTTLAGEAIRRDSCIKAYQLKIPTDSTESDPTKYALLVVSEPGGANEKAYKIYSSDFIFTAPSGNNTATITMNIWETQFQVAVIQLEESQKEHSLPETYEDYVAPPLEPTDIAATTVVAKSATLSWVSGGGTTSSYVIAYEEGETAPTSCRLATSIIGPDDIAGKTSYSIEGLKPVTTYSLRICAANSRSPEDYSSGQTLTITTGHWHIMSTVNAPSARLAYSGFWTGDKFLVYGGMGSDLSDLSDLRGLNDGFLYDPTSDSWSQIADSILPSGRTLGAGVWTGSEMIIWGGEERGSSSLWAGGINTGAIYNVAANSWRSITTTNAPEGRWDNAAVWAEDCMLIWGGFNDHVLLNDLYQYFPETDTWSKITAAGSTPTARTTSLDQGIWTGKYFAVFGGTAKSEYLGDAVVYDKSQGSYSSITHTNSPTPREYHSSIWTGSRIIVWGGAYSATVQDGSGDDDGDLFRYESILASGGIGDLDSGSWIATSTSGAPDSRFGHIAVWDGEGMIVWGGGKMGVIPKIAPKPSITPVPGLSQTPQVAAGAPCLRRH